MGGLDEDEAGGDEEMNTKFKLHFCDDFGSPYSFMDLFIVEVGCRLVSDGVFEMRKIEVLEMMRETDPERLK